MIFWFEWKGISRATTSNNQQPPAKMSVVYYLKQELQLNLPCGKQMSMKGTDVSRHKNYYRLHQKKCDLCRTIKYDAIATYAENEYKRQQAELRAMNTGATNGNGTRNIAFCSETGKQLTEDEVEMRIQEDKDAKWLTGMAMRCIKENDDATKKIDDYLCENLGMNWKAEVLFDAVQSGNL